MENWPEADWSTETDLVTELLRCQAPAYAELEVRPLASGWDNDMFVLGSDEGARFVARLPRRQVAIESTLNEHRWVPRLPELPLPVPVPIVRDEPTPLFPRPWSVCRFFEGTALAEATLAEPAEAAERLGGFFRALHVAAPRDAPDNPFRSVPLRARGDLFERSIAKLQDVLDEGRMRDAWDGFCLLPDFSATPTWLHGDVHPSNLIVHDGSLTAVIDFGDVCAGDRATDLSVAWMIFGRDERDIFRRAARVDEETWKRARGWAFSRALLFAATPGNRPEFHEMALRAIENTTEAPSP